MKALDTLLPCRTNVLWKVNVILSYISKTNVQKIMRIKVHIVNTVGKKKKANTIR